MSFQHFLLSFDVFLSYGSLCLPSICAMQNILVIFLFIFYPKKEFMLLISMFDVSVILLCSGAKYSMSIMMK